MNGNGYIYIDYDLPGMYPAEQDQTFYYWQGDPIQIAGDQQRTDLENNPSGPRMPKRSAVEKILDPVLSSPASALIVGLFILGFLLSLKGGN